MNKYILCILFLTPFFLKAAENNFIVSNLVKVSTPPPVKIAHTSNMVILKFNGWSLTHEAINPKTYVPSVDLTGIDNLFIQSLFDNSKRQKLPVWLSSLAQELSKSFAIDMNDYYFKQLGELMVYATYDKQENLGRIFILEKSQIHSINVQGSNQEFTNIINKFK